MIRTLWDVLVEAPDRGRKGRQYELPSLLGISIAAMLAGANDLVAIFRWGRRLQPEALRLPGIDDGAAPCHSTFHYVFQSLDADALAAAPVGTYATITGTQVWADSAYRSAEIEKRLETKGYERRVHTRAARNRPLSERQRAANTTRSRVRARVEHVFGHQHTAMGGKIVRSIGLVRAAAKIGMINLVYNMQRLVQLERLAAAPA